jgi:cysteine-rich repeat protein
VRHSLVVLIIALVARAAAAVPVCTASDIEASDPGCPLQGPCTITRDIEITGSCTLDFGTRPVSIGQDRKMRVAPGRSLTIQAGSFTMLPGAFIDGRVPAGADENARSASITVQATGDVVLQRRGAIDVSGSDPGGIAINAGGSVEARGSLTARGNVESGYVAIQAAGTADVGGLVDVTQVYAGSEIDIEAGSDVIVRGLRADGGGSVNIDAGRNVQILGAISLLGDVPAPGSQSYGGGLAISAERGDISIEAPITADATLHGAGGILEFEAGGAIRLAAGGHLSVRNYGSSELGEVIMYAGSSITTAARIDASGDVNGGRIYMEAGGDIAVRAPLDTSGYGSGGTAGAIEVYAGQEGRVDFDNAPRSSRSLWSGGALLIDSAVYADGGEEARDILLEGCDVSVTRRGFVSARAAGSGGPITISARASLRVDGMVTAKAFTSGFTAVEDGEISFAFPEERPPTFGARGAVRPEPTMEAFPPGTTFFDPCPICGNGVVEGAEECDDGNRTDCDGCDSNCTLSSTCGNGIRCGEEQCDAAGTANAGCCDATCHSLAAQTPCDDGELCTNADLCDGAGVCAGSATPLPAMLCRQPAPGRAFIQMVNNSPDPDGFTWRWNKGERTTLADFANPKSATPYALCVYDQSAQGQLRLATHISAGGLCPAKPCWTGSGSGFRYANRTATQSASGATQLTLVEGADNQSRVVLRGKGADLALPKLPLTPPVTVQLRNSGGGCWGATYSRFLENGLLEYRAKSD